MNLLINNIMAHTGFIVNEMLYNFLMNNTPFGGVFKEKVNSNKNKKHSKRKKK